MPSPTRIFTPASAPPPAPIAVDSDIVVILAALLCALICVVGLALVARCTWIRRASSWRRAEASANKGLKKKALRALPKTSFQASAAVSGSAASGGGCSSSDCAICLADFRDGEEIRVLPQCGHVFHVACVDTWLGSHSSCPSCRQILVVGRCQKCGSFPAPPTEGEVKAREDDANRFLP